MIHINLFLIVLY